MPEKIEFAHLHSHTDHSVLDGHASAEELAHYVAQKGQPGFAITDHGTMSNIYNAWSAAKSIRKETGEEFFFMPGIEAYVTPGDTPQSTKEAVFFSTGARENKTERSNDVSGGGAYTHMTLLGETSEGMHNLFKLNTQAWHEGIFRKPRMDIESISQHAKGVIGTTGCPSGELQTRIRLGQWKEAMEYASKMKDIFGKDNYYLELMDHNMTIDLERKVRGGLMKVAKELDLPLLATNDLHYVRREDAMNHEHMLCIQSGSSMMDQPYDLGGKRFAFQGEEYYAKTTNEMLKLFPHEDYPYAVQNSAEIVRRSTAEFEYNPDLRPSVPIPEGHTEDSYLREMVLDGLRRKRPDKVNDQEYLDRIDVELGVFAGKNFSGYMLVVSDFMRWAKAQGWHCGPGRGSGGGSAVAFFTDITEIDPIPHGLIFERFLNPERDSPPDIDSDFDDVNREKVIAYVREKYGEEMVSMIITFGVIKAKSAIKDIARIYEEPYSVGETLTKALPPAVSGKEMSLAEVYDKDSERYPEAEQFREEASNLHNKNLIPAARGIEGKMRQTGVHAAGVIMSSKPLKDSIPLMMRAKDKMTITQFDYPTCEDLGLIKMDFLGLRNLTVIDKALKSIEKNHGVKIVPQDIYDSVLENPDQKTFDMINSGRTLGIFQLDSPEIASLARLINVTSFNDISAILALYRPGPMGMGSHIKYANRKNGREEVTPIHPDLEKPLGPILDETFGLCVAGDTEIWDAKNGGILRIDSIGEQVKAGNFYTFSMNDDGGISPKLVTKWAKTGKKPIHEVKLNDGRKLRLSAEHPVLTVNGWKDTSELTLNDRLATSKNEFSPLEGSSVAIEESRLIGYLLGDGYVTTKYNAFTNSSEEITNHVSELAQGLFPDCYINHVPRKRNGEVYTNHTYFTSSPFGVGKGNGIRNSYEKFGMNTWLNEKMGISEKVLSDKKQIPQAMLSADIDAVKNFIAALWDCDGSVNNRSSYLKTISIDLARGTQYLLDRCGIHSSVLESEKYESKRGSRTAYGLFVHGVKFWDEIVPLMKHTQKKSTEYSFSGATRFEGISYKSLQKNMKPLIQNDESLPHWVLKRVNKTEWTPSKSSIRAYFERHGMAVAGDSKMQSANLKLGFVPLGSSINSYIELAGTPEDRRNANLYWNTISSIEIVDEEDVYDITVEGNHNFLANGVVVHNCVFQEQIQFIAQKVAGYSLGKADILRRAMGKKKKSILDAEFVPFSEGMRTNGYKGEAIEALWDTLVPFAEYGFNKSHSAGYGLISYLTAYLKANYGPEFMAANLSTITTDKEKTASYLQECRHMGIQVLPPDVSRSTADYTATEEGVILVGLEAIRGVGHEVADSVNVEVMENGEYKNLDDFLSRAPSAALSKGALEGFAHGGALDRFGYSRRSLFNFLPEAAKGFAQAKRKQDAGQFSLFDMVEESEAPSANIEDQIEYIKKDKLMFERHALGLYVSDHPLSGIANMLERFADTQVADVLSGAIKPAAGFGDRKTLRFAGVANSVEKKATRKGGMFASFELEDISGSLPCLIFPKAFERLGYKLDADTIYEISGNLLAGDSDDDVKFVVESLDEISLTDSGMIPFEINVMLSQASEEAMTALERVLRSHSGEMPVYMRVLDKNGKLQIFELGEHLRVSTSPLLVSEIQNLFGLKAIV